MEHPQVKPEGDKLLTEKEAAEILDVAAGTLSVWRCVRRCVRRYPLPYVRVGRNIRYTRAALQKFLESRTVAA
jgi:excisionase family DNA binding protein